MDLIDEANDLNEWINNNSIPDDVKKELKKAEMYMRKAYIMHKWALRFFNEEETSGEEYIKEVNKALVRDYKYVQVRDNMASYEV